MLKWLIRGIILIIALVGLTIAGIIFVVNPNDFKDDIQTALKNQTNLNVKFSGPLTWSFFPNLTLRAQQASLFGDSGEDVVASIGDARIGVKLTALASNLLGDGTKAIQMNEIYIKGLLLNLIEDKHGELNIVQLLSQQQTSTSVTPQDATTKKETQTKINIPAITIENSTINYTDKTQKKYHIALNQLILNKVSGPLSYDANLVSSIKGPDNLHIDIKAETQLNGDTKKQEYYAANLISTITLHDIESGKLVTALNSDRIIYSQNKNQINTSKIKITSKLNDANNKYIEANIHTQGLHINLQSNKVLSKNIRYDIQTNNIGIHGFSANGSLATVSTNIKTMLLNVQDIKLDGKIATDSKQSFPLAFQASQLSYDVDQALLTLNKSQVTTAGMKAEINLDKAKLGDTMSVSGRVSTNNFNLRELLSAFGTTIADLPSDALNTVKIRSNFNYSNDAVELNNLQANIDSSNINGTLAVKNFDAPQVNAQLTVDQLNLNRYLTTNDSNKQSKSSNNSVADASKDNSPILPIDDLRNMRINSTIKLANLKYEDQELSNISCRINNDGKQLTLSACSANTLGGRIAPSLTLTLTDTPNIQGALNASGFALDTLSELVTNKSIVAGQAGLQLAFNTSGNSSAAWINHNKGKADIDLKELLIKNINLNNILNEKIGPELNQILSASLKEKGISLPLSNSKDTYIKHLHADAVIDGAKISFENINGALKTNDKIKGNFSFDPLSNDFDAQLKITLNHYKKHPYLANVEWPLRCNGNIDASPLTWCGVDTQSMNAIMKTVAVNATKNKARELLESKLGLKTDPNKSIDVVAKEELEKRAAEKLQPKADEINQKIEDKKKELNDKVNDQLNKALGGFLGGKK